MSEVLLQEFTVPENPALYELPEPLEGTDTSVRLTHRNTNETQNFVVTTFGDPGNLDRVIVDATAYSVDYSSEAERKRSGMMAAMGFFVVGVSLPGFRMGKNGRVSPFTETQLEGLREGDWTPYAKDAWKAIHKVVDHRTARDNALSGSDLLYDGHSLGVSTSAAMLATSPDSSKNTKFLGYEGVGWELPGAAPEARLAAKWGMTIVQFMAGKRAMMKENGDAIDVTALGKEGKAVPWNKEVAMALARANDTRVLIDGVSLNQSRGIDVGLWFGDKSSLSKEGANRRAARFIAPIVGSEHVDLVVGRGEGHASEDHVRRAIARKDAFYKGKPYSRPVGKTA